MGMFDKDKVFGVRLDQEFRLGEHFILRGVNLTGETIDTNFGPAEVVRLTVSKLSKPDYQYECQTVASAIVDKAREAEDGDFPAVVSLIRVKTKNSANALVLQFIAPYAESYGYAPDDEDIPF